MNSRKFESILFTSIVLLSLWLAYGVVDLVVERADAARNPLEAETPVDVQAQVVAESAVVPVVDASPAVGEASSDQVHADPAQEDAGLPTVRGARARALRSMGFYLLGMIALGAARAYSLRRGRRNLPAFWILPAVACATGIGLVSQMTHGNPLVEGSWRGPGFAVGVGLAAVLSAAILAMPTDPLQLLRRYRLPATLFVVFGGVLLWLFGSGPEGTRSQINLHLGPLSMQPIEAIKLAFVCLMGLFLGEKAVQLRYQRVRAGWLQFPRPRYLAAACAALGALFMVLALLVRDLGPTLVLSSVFLLLFYLSTRASGWLIAALSVLAFGFWFVSLDPSITGSQTLATRFDMWRNPWMNGLPHGSQLAASLWAIAAGGFGGRGLGEADVAALPASHTDLMIAHVAETTGLWGGLLYLICLGACILQGLAIAARNREPERVLIGAACCLLLLSQWAVIFGGTTGLLPLTGLAVPFLSYGKSSMIAFLLAVAIVLRLSEDGAPRAATTELRELRAAVSRVAVASAVVLCAAGAFLLYLGVVRGPDYAARGVLETLADGTTRIRHDPRLSRAVARIRRGALLDRHGEVLVGTRLDGRREYPLGDALGALVCPPDAGRVLRRDWCLERIHELTLRGYPEQEVRPALWRTPDAMLGERTLFAVATGEETADDRQRATLLAGGEPVRFVPLSVPDLSSMAGLVRSRKTRSREQLEALSQDVAARSVRLTLDAGLQQKAAEILVKHLGEGAAAATVVLDVDTGEVLARAQVPDVDLSTDDWYRPVIDGDPRYTGIYGPWVDKTGTLGFKQAGSIAKLFTTLAAAREGLPTVAVEGCNIRSTRTFECTKRDHIGSVFDRPGWVRPIHDHPKDRSHGVIDVSEALARSCNVAFSELTLDTGPGPLRRLSQQVDIGWERGFEPGAPGTRRLASTGIGQGAAVFNVSQAARMVAAIGGGGVYRRCPPGLRLGDACEETMLVDDPSRLGILLAGMRRAMQTGTGSLLPKVPGVRMYGKTGTADSEPTRDEKPYGIGEGEESLPPHSWFVALAEPEGSSPCGTGNSGRLAVATLIARGGGGTRAGAATVEIIAAARNLGYLGDGP